MGEEKMTVKAPFYAVASILVLCMCIGEALWGLQQINWDNLEDIIFIIIMSGFMVIAIWYIFRSIFETSKKLIMDKEGCTVSVWGYKKNIQMGRTVCETDCIQYRNRFEKIM